MLAIEALEAQGGGQVPASLLPASLPAFLNIAGIKVPRKQARRFVHFFILLADRAAQNDVSVCLKLLAKVEATLKTKLAGEKEELAANKGQEAPDALAAFVALMDSIDEAGSLIRVCKTTDTLVPSVLIKVVAQNTEHLYPALRSFPARAQAVCVKGEVVSAVQCLHMWEVAFAAAIRADELKRLQQGRMSLPSWSARHKFVPAIAVRMCLDVCGFHFRSS
jgi:hypothetical protein